MYNMRTFQAFYVAALSNAHWQHYKTINQKVIQIYKNINVLIF